MNIKNIEKCLSKNILDAELLKIFNESDININEELTLKTGDYQTYIERPDEGICYVFTDEAVYLDNSEQVIGEGPLYLSSVFFYSEGKDDYSQYKKGALPFDLTFKDTKEVINNKLGSPDWDRDVDGKIVSERWDKDGFRVQVDYSVGNTPQIISYGVIPAYVY